MNSGWLEPSWLGESAPKLKGDPREKKCLISATVYGDWAGITVLSSGDINQGGKWLVLFFLFQPRNKEVPIMASNSLTLIVTKGGDIIALS